MPARAQAAGQILSAMTQDDERHATFFCRKGKASQRHKIKLFRMAPGLEQNGSKGGATQRVFSRFQSVFRATRGNEQKTGGIKPEIFEPRPINAPALMAGHLFADPDPVPFLREPSNEAERKTRGGGEIARALRTDFMQGIARESSAQRLIDALMTGRGCFRRRIHGAQAAIPADFRDRLAQGLQI